ncbi:pyrroline-5-carboxylate reductase [Thalassorhabdus alkalitolerans]|uniref:Pyrroline-5-carboxylate reductase n=1 Tax=Thalassorhabdus alkalitolerans TaxID=2282697 RepID=A0ABW0YIU6_9BACI
MLRNYHVTFVGAGSMAESIIGGLLSKELLAPEQITATNNSEKERLTYLSDQYGINTTSDKEAAVGKANIVVLAVKPKHVEEAISDIQSVLGENQLLISVLAGISTAYIQKLCQKEIPIIRTMPNTSAKVGASATAMTPGSFASKQDLAVSQSLFQAIGTVTTLEEGKLDAVTGLSGSGPAYVYYIVEAMEQAARETGLEEQEAKELIIQTLYGASKRLQNTDKSSRELYKEVMSPGGTTEAAFEVLESHGVQHGLQKAIERAVKRSEELGVSSKTPTSS